MASTPSPHTRPDLARAVGILGAACALGCALTGVAGCSSGALASLGLRKQRPQNSAELQALARAEEARFARAVAEEARSPRVAVEALEGAVLIDRSRGLVYVSAPHFAALDLASGAERWSWPEVAGSFARSAAAVVVVGAEAPRKPVLWSFAPGAAPSPPPLTRCALALPLPPEADEVAVLPFDRRCTAYVFYASTASHRQGGPPPSEDELRRSEAGRACGVVQLLPSGCQSKPQRLEPFLLDPPRDLGALVELEPTDCRYLAPDLQLPAVAASRPPQAAGEQVPRLAIVRTGLPSEGCVRHTAVRLEATDAAGRVLWSRALPAEVSRSACPGPP